LFVAGKRPPSGVQTLRTLESLISDRLPKAWSLRAIAPLTKGRRRLQTVWALQPPDGSAAEFVVEVLGVVVPRELPDLVARVRQEGPDPLIAAPYLSPRAREVLTKLGVSYADTTGNLRIVASEPGLFIEAQGAPKDPWPSDQRLQSLRGRGAGRAVRAVVDYRPPYGVRDLAQRAEVPLGSLSRVLDLLDRDGLITRDTRGSVTDVDWAGVIRRWSRDYDVARSNQVSTYLDPRGLGPLATKLDDVRWQYATTGAFAAQRFAPIAPARTATLFVDDVSRAAGRLKLQPADAGANVLLVEPYDPVVFERTTVRDRLRVVALSQLAVDLLTGTGREPSEGEELLAWMGKHERAWRT
jgi:hypothetical protein